MLEGVVCVLQTNDGDVDHEVLEVVCVKLRTSNNWMRMLFNG